MQSVIATRTASLRGLKALRAPSRVSVSQVQAMTGAQVEFAPSQVDSICGASTESQSG